MENKNKMALIIKIILIFFLIIGLGMAGFFYFYYHNNILKVVKEGIQIEKDEDFEKIIKDKTQDEENSNSKDAIVRRNCFINGIQIKDGDSIDLYSKNIVHPFEDCNNFKKKRFCDNGFLLGDDIYEYTECTKKLDCQLPDGTIIKNGEEMKLYSRSRVPYNKRGEVCEKYAQIRKCKETILSGNEQYIYRECRISYDNSCRLLNGKIIANNESFVAYKKNKVAWNEKCNQNDNMKIFMCSETQITGGDLSQYPYLECQSEAAKNCNLILNTPEGEKEKVIFKHGETDIPLFSRGYRTHNHSCAWYENDFSCENGIMDGGDYSLDEYNFVRCYEN